MALFAMLSIAPAMADDEVTAMPISLVVPLSQPKTEAPQEQQAEPVATTAEEEKPQEAAPAKPATKEKPALPASEKPAEPAAKEEKSKPPLVALRVGEHETYDRIVFDWPRQIPYKVQHNGENVTVHFAAPGTVQLAPTSKLKRARSFASATGSDGNLTVTFRVDATSDIKDFFSGSSTAIDIVDPPKTQKPKEKKPEPAKKEPVKEPVKEPIKQEAPKPPEVTPAKPAAEEKPKPATEKPAPADKAPEKPPAAAATVPVTPATPATTPAPQPQPAQQLPALPEQPAATPAKPEQTTAPAQPAAQPEPATTPAPATPPAQEQTSTDAPKRTAIGKAPAVTAPAPAQTPAPQPQAAKPAPDPEPDNTPVVSNIPRMQKLVMPDLNLSETPMLVASLDPHIGVRAAVWARAGYGYIVFDKKITLSADALVAGLPPPLVPLQPLDLPTASGFRFPVTDTTDIRIAREGTAWKIFFAKQQPNIPVSATLIAQPDFALGARYLLPLPDAPEPVRMIDPVVGDDLIIVPLNLTQSFSVMRRMANFQIWPAAQGMVLKPLMDKLIVRSVLDGLEITSEAGLHLSAATDTGANQQSSQKARAAAAGKSLFDFAMWRGKPNETFTEARRRLQQTIVDVPEQQRPRARLELARFYFARGYGPEAVGLLNYLSKDIPDLKAHSDFLALMGAAKVLSNRPEDGLRDLEAANLTEQPEINLWRAVANAERRDWATAEDNFVNSEALLAGYPEPFYSRFMILAVEAAVAVGNDREAADWLDTLENAPHNPDVDVKIEYLHGVLHAKSGRGPSAMTSWKRVMGSDDRLYKVRAELALIDLGVANLSLTPAQAADRLEALRFAWRGDDLEVDILHRLGQFYIKAKNVKAGLGSLAQATQLYPKSPMAPAILQEMMQTFRDVFLGELGKKLSPVEALTLYQQYRNTLIPSGDAGIAVMRNLAERLAAIDLMDQASDLLEDLVKNKLNGIEKARVVARLAALRLLDHKPQLALEALNLTNGEALPDNMQHERDLLHAKALSQMNRNDDALAVIKDDMRFPAKLLRADINMGAQHWEEAAKNLLDLVGAPPKPGQQLSEDQADWLIRAAVAMSMSNDQTGLDRIAIDYGAAMAGTQQNDTFRVLVQPEKAGQLRDIATAQSRISDVDMFQGFLNSYRKADTSDAAPKNTKTP